MAGEIALKKVAIKDDSLRRHGFAFFDPSMKTFACKNHQVFRTIVRLVFVYMMNNFGRFEKSAKKFLGNNPMFVWLAIFIGISIISNRNFYITGLGFGFSAFPTWAQRPRIRCFHFLFPILGMLVAKRIFISTTGGPYFAPCFFGKMIGVFHSFIPRNFPHVGFFQFFPVFFGYFFPLYRGNKFRALTPMILRHLFSRLFRMGTSFIHVLYYPYYKHLTPIHISCQGL